MKKFITYFIKRILNFSILYFLKFTYLRQVEFNRKIIILLSFANAIFDKFRISAHQ